MIDIYITLCIITAIICSTVCFIYKEKTYSTTDLSKQQLLEDINIRATSVCNKFLDTFNVPDNNENKKYRDLFDAIEDIIKMTYNYKKDY